MNKRVYRYFFDFIDGQVRWLNSMAEHGFRLVKCGRLSYLFEECAPNEYEYAVEFVGDKSNAKSMEYQHYLSDMGYRVFTKNIIINYSYGKVELRLYGKGMGKLATSPGNINKELLILEKKKDGKPFALHTSSGDMLEVYSTIRNAYLQAVIPLLALLVLTLFPGLTSLSSLLFWMLRGVLTVKLILYAAPMLKYALRASHLKEEGKTIE